MKYLLIATCMFFAHAEASQPDSTKQSSYELHIGGGLNLTRSGDQSEIAGRGGNVTLGVTGYRSSNWGLGLMAVLDTLGSTPNISKLTSVYFPLAITYRDQLSTRWRWHYDVGPALGMVFHTPVSGDTDSSTTFAIFQRLTLHFVVSRDDGEQFRERSIGIGLIDVYTLPFSKAHGVSFGGNVLGAALYFTSGF